MLLKGIKERRIALRMTQGQLAYRLGITQNAVSMIERGLRTPSVEMTAKIADVFGCTVDELIGRPRDESA